MLSVEKEHPVYAESCHSLCAGLSAYSVAAEIPFDLHRYKDGWHVYWKNPPSGKIGRHLKTREQLISFLAGNWRVGTALVWPFAGSLSSKRTASRGK